MSGNERDEQAQQEMERQEQARQQQEQERAQAGHGFQAVGDNETTTNPVIINR